MTDQPVVTKGAHHLQLHLLLLKLRLFSGYYAYFLLEGQDLGVLVHMLFLFDCE